MAFRIAVLGAGAVGARVVRQLASTPEVHRLAVADLDRGRADAVVRAIGEPGRVRAADVADRWWAGADVAVIATPAGHHHAPVERLLEDGVNVVSTSDDVDDVRHLLALDPEARERGVTVAVGAAFAPGLTCVLAAHAAASFDVVDEIHVAKVGTGGPACASAHHRGLAGEAIDWREGAWVRRRGGSGRELCWFPDPIGAEDCYRAAAPDALVLVPAFPGVARVTARVGANRRDRLTAHLPMLRRPHPEGGPGAVRVEVRGMRGSGSDVRVLGAMDRPALAAGAVAALAATVLAGGGAARTGAGGLAALVAPVPFLAELSRRGVKAAVFEGA
ncbi:MAG TPA: Gfo/Idh/MocA family oxidoreductase [Acidimicrobiales bacterium]|nr:Gfo/Idh/MocA family oxidoreductase [Acidimicrobiales bacterium]